MTPMSLADATPLLLASKASRRPVGATRHEELVGALRKALRHPRRLTILEQAEVERVARLAVLAEQAAADPHTSVDVRLRAEAAADTAVRRLLGSRIAVLEASHGGR
jgi:hypothetical protein